MWKYEKLKFLVAFIRAKTKQLTKHDIEKNWLIRRLGFIDSKNLKKANKTALNDMVYLKGGSLKNAIFPI